jgi:hypothetical protein
LDEAVQAGLVQETGADPYRFANVLVRTTLYEELSATRRRPLHRRVGEAIEKLRPDDVVALAFHFSQAGPDGDGVSQAVRYGLAAADQALQARALDIARGLGDGGLLAWVLNRTGYAAFAPDRAERLVARGEEATRLSDATGDPAQRVLSRYYYGAHRILATVLFAHGVWFSSLARVLCR